MATSNPNPANDLDQWRTHVAICRTTLHAEAERIRHMKTQWRQALQAARAIQDDGARDKELLYCCGLYESTKCPSQRARCAGLALGLLRGKTYLQIEASTRTPSHVLQGPMAREIAKKAGVSYDQAVDWLRGRFVIERPKPPVVEQLSMSAVA